MLLSEVILMENGSNKILADMITFPTGIKFILYKNMKAKKPVGNVKRY